MDTFGRSQKRTVRRKRLEEVAMAEDNGTGGPGRPGGPSSRWPPAVQFLVVAALTLLFLPLAVSTGGITSGPGSCTSGITRRIGKAKGQGFEFRV